MNNIEYLVVSRSNGTTKTGAPYASLKVANLLETINVAVWDMKPEASPQVGQLVVFYNIKDNDGKKSCDVRDLKATRCSTIRSTILCLGPYVATSGTTRSITCFPIARTRR